VPDRQFDRWLFSPPIIFAPKTQTVQHFFALPATLPPFPPKEEGKEPQEPHQVNIPQRESRVFLQRKFLTGIRLDVFRVVVIIAVVSGKLPPKNTPRTIEDQAKARGEIICFPERVWRQASKRTGTRQQVELKAAEGMTDRIRNT
jgi:hypothetical protein